jgi:23S rRNA (cytidine1920-2'-O)/16S rRNA (cytidine1409-2'-O)-methyltransferase
VKKERLDKLMVARELARSRNRAQRLIRAGEVRVEGEIADKPGTRYPEDAAITVAERPPFVGRGGEKLEAALQHFPVDVEGRVAADIGASTGGFTDCLLQRGAAKVYAVDVGYGQLAWKLRQDVRVVVMERTNARYLKSLPEPVDLIVSDVSFISLRLIYQAAVQWLRPEGDVVSLIKPQFEAGRAQVGKGGVIRDPAVHRDVLETVTGFMAEFGLQLQGLMVSPLVGPAGNVEFLGWWQFGEPLPDRISWIEDALSEASALR